jgi:NADP-reducing hydrogenase subunit HndB
MRLSDPAALKALRESARAELAPREGPKALRVTVHMGTCGIAAGARDVMATLLAQLAKAGAEVTVRQSGCAGLCDQEPMLTLTDAEGREYRYGRLDATRVRAIVDGHVVGGNPVTTYLIQV